MGSSSVIIGFVDNDKLKRYVVKVSRRGYFNELEKEARIAKTINSLNEYRKYFIEYIEDTEYNSRPT